MKKSKATVVLTVIAIAIVVIGRAYFGSTHNNEPYRSPTGTTSYETSNEVVSSNFPASSASSSTITSSAGKVPAASEAESSVVSKAVQDTPESTIVYITNTDKKYHRAECKYLKQSFTKISLNDAKAEGYSPCSECDPPK